MGIIILLFYISLLFISVIILFTIRIIISKCFKKRIPITVLLAITVTIMLIIPVDNLISIARKKINETVINRKYNENDYLKFNENELMDLFGNPVGCLTSPAFLGLKPRKMLFFRGSCSETEVSEQL